MDTIQLNHALRSRVDIPPGIYRGAFAINQVPYVYSLDKPYALIVNTAPWPLDGDHWVALFCQKNGVIEYFDSVGNPPPNKLRLPTPTTVVYSPQRLQHHCTSVCGEYCILFLYCRLKGVSIGEFVSCFSTTDLLRNDRKALHTVHQYFDILPHTRPYPAIDKLCVQVSK